MATELENWDIEEKEDSAEKLANVAGKPTKYYLFASEFMRLKTFYNAIKTKFSELNLQFITTGTGANETSNNLIVKRSDGSKRSIIGQAYAVFRDIPGNKELNISTYNILYRKPDGTIGSTEIVFNTGSNAGIINIPNFSGTKTLGFVEDFPTIPSVPTELSQLSQDPDNRTVTDDEINYWNNKQEALTIDTSVIQGSFNPVTSDAVYQEVISLNNSLSSKLSKSLMLYNTMLTPIRSNAGLTVVGMTGANTESLGNAPRNYANTSKFTTMNRLGYVTTAVAGYVSYFRQTTDIVSMLFPFEACFSFGKGTNVANQRSVFGFINGSSAPSNVEATTLLNSFGVCELSTSSNWHMFHNDGAGLANVIDLGVNFPCRNNNTDIVNAYFRNILGVGIYYEIECNGNILTGLIESDLPTTATNLTYKWWTTNNTTAASCSVEFFKFILNQNLQ